MPVRTEEALCGEACCLGEEGELPGPGEEGTLVTPDDDEDDDNEDDNGQDDVDEDADEEDTD
eukprot:CAMPEP_0172532442 /NCGR_PEP_ID=MMETSP1067-20121228/5495_1 /TAXON_ID=265564 ORGANISM="Thalassiosira punctigera, Strain Tpunct2005C2" /NCGR_SAMPLE_ID=MMETSP1067 /ASSEMBLY_ACC=CAM_ASM_000444 /LENGTH=61 /DNA_ID=CAMNT_0013316963 /DNA_START=291 /DNA_END=473 /DNA_ORIENTATION=-